jgi:SAM-dependent methyltransferase
MSIFKDPTTRVKINTETYIKFDGTDTLLIRNIQNEDGVGIKYDILLILYEMVDWVTIEQLISPWPQGDQEKIMSHLEMLASRNIVITSQDQVATVNESGLSEHLGRNIHINVENHHAMLRDSVRMVAYRRAIESAVKPDTVAMDLGCGTGILSFFAASAGAKKVFAIERRSDIIFMARELAAANGFDKTIEFIEGTSSQLPESRIEPKVDLLVAEILGNGILEENVLEFTIDARRRFLKPGAAMIPYGLDIYFFGFDSGHQPNRWQEVQELNELYGYDFNILGQVLCGKATTRMDRYNTHVYQAMSAPVLARSLDFRTMEDAAFSCKATLEALEDGQMTSFCGYFKAHLDEKNVLTNSPWAPSTHWTQLIYTLAAPKKVKKGEMVEISIIYDGALRVYLADQI